jgi:PAS domain S-box-containing protein
VKTTRRLTSEASPEFAITAILAESPSLSQAMPEVLQVIGEGFGWDIAEAWALIPDAGLMELRTVWYPTSYEAASEWDTVHRGISVRRGHGLIGRAWDQCKPQWTDDIRTDSRFARKDLAVKLGLSSACAIPIVQEGAARGAIALFSREARSRDEVMIGRLSAISDQVSRLLHAHRSANPSERVLSDLVNSMQDVLAIFKLDGTIEYENAAVERVLGYLPEELIGRNVFDFVHPDDLPNVLDAFHRAVADPGSAQQAELRARHRSGEWVWLEARGSVQPYKSELVMVAVSRDITERRGQKGEGGKPASPEMASGPASALTAGELRVVRLVMRGLSNPEIARALSLSPHTVKEYVSKISRKLGARNRAQIAAIAVELNIT